MIGFIVSALGVLAVLGAAFVWALCLAAAALRPYRAAI